MQVLKPLHEMTPEEGAAVLNQMFNPLRGLAVGYKGNRRGGAVRSVARPLPNKAQKEARWRAARQMDLFTER